MCGTISKFTSREIYLSRHTLEGCSPNKSDFELSHTIDHLHLGIIIIAIWLCTEVIVFRTDGPRLNTRQGDIIISCSFFNILMSTHCAEASIFARS